MARQAQPKKTSLYIVKISGIKIALGEIYNRDDK